MTIPEVNWFLKRERWVMEGEIYIWYGQSRLKSSIWQERWSNWRIYPDKDIMIKIVGLRPEKNYMKNCLMTLQKKPDLPR
jgi:hypothetical protein